MPRSPPSPNADTPSKRLPDLALWEGAGRGALLALGWGVAWAQAQGDGGGLARRPGRVANGRGVSPMAGEGISVLAISF
ncbi:hypothetical protein TIFTF001_019227 [Ficus carica]|uniref:Uncharacterized protein n=1 Tax=Ficus carica TaxID=3494 RepID=A0AA88DBK2_FICCA|nr:hypothetical protein TIFTF001_019227 [Ficus carica]